MPHVTEEIWSHLPAARVDALIVAPWPEAGDEDEAGALERVQEFAQVFRRSGVVPQLDGDEQRIFAAVVKPDRAPQARTATPTRSGSGCASEIARAERMLANERFVAERSRRGRRRRAREARALPPRARCHRRLNPASPSPWLESLSPWPTDGFGTERMRALLDAARQPAARLPRRPRRRHEGQVDGDAPHRRARSAAPAYTSPHVSGWHERLETDPDGFERAVARVRADAEAVGATQFEAITAAAFADFAARGVEPSPRSRPASAAATTRRT